MTLTFTENGHRYRLDGAPVPSVTTIIKAGVPAPALVGWAAKMVAEAVADLPSTVDELRRLGREPFIKALSAAPNEARNRASVRGIEIHALAEAVVHGEAVEIPPHLLDAVQGYILFLDASGLTPIHTERPVASRTYRYAGRFDLLGEIRGQTWLLDVKTGSGIYGETALQVAAYAHADFMVSSEDGQEVRLPFVDKIGALHVQPGGTDLYDLGDPEKAFTEFLAARETYLGGLRRKREGLTDNPVLITSGEGLW